MRQNRWTLLRHRSFLFVWSSSLISGLGDAIYLLAVTWIAATSAHKGVALGLLGLCWGLPQIGLSLVAGVWVDRLDPLRMFRAAHLVRAFAMGGVFLVGHLFGEPPLLVLYGAAVVMGTADAFVWPAASALRQRLVEAEQQVQASGWFMIAMRATDTLGPALGGLLLWLGGSHNELILGNGLSFVLAWLLLLRVKIAPVQASETKANRSFRKDLLEGLRFYTRSKIMLVTSSAAFIVNACIATAAIALPVLLQEHGFGVQSLAALNSSFGVGGAVGAAFFAMMPIRYPSPRMTLWVTACEGLIFMMFGMFGMLWVMLVLMALRGMTDTAVNVIAPSVNQHLIPPAMMGRVISVLILVMSGSEPLVKGLVGPLLDVVGPAHLLIGCGLLQLMVSLTFRLFPTVRQFDPKQPSKTTVVM